MKYRPKGRCEILCFAQCEIFVCDECDINAGNGNEGYG